jgi:DNA-binding beta-propeller fold protein YncE
MRRIHMAFVIALAIATFASTGLAQKGMGPYKVIKTVKVGGDGGFDYVFADSAARRLYIPRSGPNGRILVFNLDTLAPVGEIAGVNGHGTAVDPKTNHGFVTSKPIVMFDSKTLAKIKTIDVEGNPDGILFDPYNQHLYDFSHRQPNVTVIDTKDGSIVGTIADLGGAPEQAVTDLKGHIYVNLEDKSKIAVVDTNTLKVTGYYDLSSKGGTCASLAFDIKNHILFSGCREPQVMVILNSEDGKIITALPIGEHSDGAIFNPNTMEAITSLGEGTLTVVKENSPTSFVLEQNLKTMPNAKTLTLDSKTNHLYLIGAEYGPLTATSRRGGPPGGIVRGPMLPGSFSILEVGK